MLECVLEGVLMCVSLPPRPPALAHLVTPNEKNNAKGTARINTAGPARMQAAADK